MLARLAACLGMPQEAARQHGSPHRAPTSPTAPALALPPADSSLPLAAGSLAFTVPPSLDVALDVLAAQHPAFPKGTHADAVTETAAACAAGLRSYRQRMAPEQRRRERRRLAREQGDHLKTLEELGRGLQAPPAPAAQPHTTRPASAGAAAKPQRPQQRQAPPPPFVLAPVFQTGGGEASTQLVPLHRNRQAQPPLQAALPSPVGHAAAAAAAARAAPASSAGSASMQSATSRLAGEEAAAASSGSCSSTAGAASLLPCPSLGRSSAATGGSGAGLAASTLAHAVTSGVPFAAGSSPSAACQGASPTAAWAAGRYANRSGRAAWEGDLIELELVDATGACVERLPPQPSPQPSPQSHLVPPCGARPARPSPDTAEAVPAHTTPSFLAVVVGMTRAGGPAGGGSGHGSACNSTAASHALPHAGAEGSAAASAASGSPGGTAAVGASASASASAWAVSSQVALLDAPAVGSTGSPYTSGRSPEVSGTATAAAASAAPSQAGAPGALLSSFKRVLHGRLQQRAAAKQLGGSPPAAASKQRASTHLVAVAAAAPAVDADAEDVAPRRPAAGRRSANENWPVLV